MRPTDEAIVKVIAEHFQVSMSVAWAWFWDIVRSQKKIESREDHDL
jgi:hypothetical protein